MLSADSIVTMLDLKPHPEGGYFKEVYRCEETIPASGLPDRYRESRSVSTSIYFMLVAGQKSHFHKVASDETWHHYLGDAVKLHIVSPRGEYKQVVVGKELGEGQKLQYTVPADHWFAGEVLNPNGFVLVGCTVAPGFDFADFQLASLEDFRVLNKEVVLRRPDLFLRT